MKPVLVFPLGFDVSVEHRKVRGAGRVRQPRFSGFDANGLFVGNLLEDKAVYEASEGCWSDLRARLVGPHANPFGCPESLSFGPVLIDSANDHAPPLLASVWILFSPTVNPYIWSFSTGTYVHCAALVSCPPQTILLFLGRTRMACRDYSGAQPDVQFGNQEAPPPSVTTCGRMGGQ
jgi:hypothetical protein